MIGWVLVIGGLVFVITSGVLLYADNIAGGALALTTALFCLVFDVYCDMAKLEKRIADLEGKT